MKASIDGGLPEAMTGAIQSEDFKAAMASFAAGVTIISTMDDSGAPYALTATAFSSVSLSPPLCLVCIDKHARTRRFMLLKRAFAVSVLSAGQETLSTRFASRLSDKFEAVRWYPGPSGGCPLIDGALAWLECKVAEVYEGGDHDIFLGSVLSARVRDGAPLVYYRGGYSSLPPRTDARTA